MQSWRVKIQLKKTRHQELKTLIMFRNYIHEGCCKMWTRDWKGASTNFLEAVGIKWNCACPKTEPKREASNTL